MKESNVINQIFSRPALIHSGSYGGGGYEVDFFPVFWGGLDSLDINQLRTPGVQVRTPLYGVENRRQWSEVVVELFME